MAPVEVVAQLDFPPVLVLEGRVERQQRVRVLVDLDAFQFRAATNPSWATWGVQYQDLVVTLVDGDGNSATVGASDVGNEALKLMQARRGDHFMLNQLRFPLDMFTGVNLGDIRSVEIGFNRTNAGVIDIADANFTADRQSWREAFPFKPNGLGLVAPGTADAGNPEYFAEGVKMWVFPNYPTAWPLDDALQGTWLEERLATR